MSGAATDPIQQRYRKLEQLRELGHEPYPYRFEWTHAIPRLLEEFADSSGEELEARPVEVAVAGRLIALRGHGKVGFGHLLGGGERIQIYVRKDRVGDENYRLFKLLDIGDVVGVQGVMFRTRTGELTVFADRLELLAKSLLPLPEKWHGLTDVELRYRQRYLDLIANPEVRGIFERRSALIRELRTFLEEEGYLEVETPMMQPLAGGATARPFETHHEALGIPLYLRIAPELYLKRLTVGGFDRVYEINRNFRNEGISSQHNPEFTMLEFYQAYSDYHDLMELTERMLRRVVKRVCGGLRVKYGEVELDFGRYERISLLEAARRHWPGGDPPSAESLLEREGVLAALEQLDLEPVDRRSWGRMLAQLFEEVAEPHLIQPTFVYDYPLEVSPLAKEKMGDPRFVERFEMYVAGFEVANGYSELNDPEEQRRRFQLQLEQRERGDREAHAMDEDYLRALRHGLPPTAGEGIGIDRLTMVLTDSPSIRQVILFPQLRPESGREQ